MYRVLKLSDSKVINELKKVLTNHIKKQGGFAWMNQVFSRVYQNASIDLKDALIGIQENFRKYLTNSRLVPRYI